MQQNGSFLYIERSWKLIIFVSVDITSHDFILFIIIWIYLFIIIIFKTNLIFDVSDPRLSHSSSN
jgi:hypothetical protein